MLSEVIVLVSRPASVSRLHLLLYSHKVQGPYETLGILAVTMVGLLTVHEKNSCERWYLGPVYV